MIWFLFGWFALIPVAYLLLKSVIVSPAYRWTKGDRAITLVTAVIFCPVVLLLGFLERLWAGFDFLGRWIGNFSHWNKPASW